MERRVKYALKARFSVSALMGFMVNYATRMPTCVSWAFVKTMPNAPMATAPIILAYVVPGLLGTIVIKIYTNANQALV